MDPQPRNYFLLGGAVSFTPGSKVGLDGPVTISPGASVAINNPSLVVSFDNIPQPVIVQNFPSQFSILNFPAVQPISGSVAVTNFPASVSINNLPGTQPISGTVSIGNFPITQQVADTNNAFFPALGLSGDPAANSFTGNWSITSLLKGIIKSLSMTLQVAINNFPSVWDISDRAARLLGHVQVDNFPAVAARAYVTLSWERLAGGAAESALTNFTNGTKAGVALSAASSYTVTAGKTFRITAINVSAIATANTIFNSRLRIRQAAAVTNSSPIIWQCEAGMGAATAANQAAAATTGFEIPDGLEIPAGQQITFTHIESAATGLISLVIIGYEY